MGKTNGRSTVYNDITSDEKLKQVNEDNIELENDFIEYLTATDKSKNTIKQYTNNLHVIWCWSLDFNKNKAFVDFTKREITKFQNHALNVWGWSPSRLRTVKATARSLENYIENMLDDEFPNYRAIWNKIENPVNEPVREKSVFTIADLQPLLDYLVEKKQFKRACILALAMYSGRRKAELCRFKVSDFDDDKLVCDGALYKSSPLLTKGNKYLECYTLAKRFKPYLDLWMQQRSQLGIDSEWLFPDRSDYTKSRDPRSLNSWTEKFSRMTGKDFYMHALRHYFVSALSREGLPDNVIVQIIGWSSSEMFNVYNDNSKDDQIAMFFKDGEISVEHRKDISDL